MLVTIAKSVRGSEHIKQDKLLQDSSETYSDDYLALAIVADGHGGDKYIRSDVGSREAVFRAKIFTYKMVKGNMEPFIKKKDTESIKSNLELLKGHIIREWRECVTRHYHRYVLSEKELSLCNNAKITLPIDDNEIPILYGTTLLICGYIEEYDFWFALQIGDGTCIAFKADDTPFYPIPKDEKLGFGVTTSLCSKNAGTEFHYAFGFEKLNGIAVMTDGLTDSFATEKLPDFILNIKKNALTDLDATKTELEKFLPKLSEQGSGDDISVAAIFMKDLKENKRL